MGKVNWDAINPKPKLELPEPTIKTEDWLGKEPYPKKSEMEKRLWEKQKK